MTRSKINLYLEAKASMMLHLQFATENVSLEDTLHQLIFYHYYKDIASKYYFQMTHEERKTLHTLMIL